MVILCRQRNIDIYTESGTVFPGDIVTGSRIQSEVAEKQSRIPLDIIKEEEEEDVAPLTRRSRQDRGREVVETVVVADTSEEKDEAKGKGVVVASEEVVAAGTEVNPQRQDKGKAVMVADISEEKEIEAETGRKEDTGDVKASEEIVPAESEVNPQGQDKAAVVQEICEEDDVQAEIEYNQIRRARGKTKVGEEEEDEAGKASFMSEITPAAEAAPKRLMNIKLKWLAPVEQGQTTQSQSVRCPQTIRGTRQDPPLHSNRFHNTFNNNCCTLM